MIKLTDTVLLAYTKLRTRKIRTIITVFLASLLFGVLVAASLVTAGVFRSVEAFRQDGLTSRYIVGVLSAPSSDPLVLQKLLRDPTLIAEAKRRYEKLVDDKTAEAKRLGIAYHQASDQPPYSINAVGDGAERLTFNDRNGVVRQLLKEKFVNDPAFDDARLQQRAEQYRAIDIFAEEQYSVRQGSSLTIPKDDREVFYDVSDEAEVNIQHEQSAVSLNGLTLVPPEISTPFLLPNNAGWKPDSSSLPIILPQDKLEQLLGMDVLPAGASAEEKTNRLKAVREKAGDMTFQACYRNSISQARIQQVVQQQKEIAANANNKDYQKPTVIYTLPDPSSCGDVAVQTDTRSTAEVALADNQKQFDKTFGQVVDPVSYFVSFKVVGISPASANSGAQGSQEQLRSVDDAIATLLKTNGLGEAIPAALYNQLPDKEKYQDILDYSPTYLFGNEDNKKRYIEFATAHDAQKFIDEQSCTMQYDNTCKPLGRSYMAMLEFSNAAALDDIRDNVVRWMGYAMLGVVILAAIVMWIAVGRTISDGRHETAVFRAIGFKRIDITMIYMVYVAVLSVSVVLWAGLLGTVTAYVVNWYMSPILTAQAQYGFSGLDLSHEITLIGVDSQQLLIIFGACLAAGLLSACMPILLNVRRNPIRDMREE